MHVFSPDLNSTVDNGRIHDHRFSFESRVIIGELHNTKFRVMGEGDPVTLWNVTDSGFVYKKHALLERFETDVVRTGETYKMFGPGDYHETEHVDQFTVTVMTKTNVVDNYQPIVVSFTEDEPDDAYESATVDQDVIDSILDCVSHIYEELKREYQGDEDGFG